IDLFCHSAGVADQRRFLEPRAGASESVDNRSKAGSTPNAQASYCTIGLGVVSEDLSSTGERCKAFYPVVRVAANLIQSRKKKPDSSSHAPKTMIKRSNRVPVHRGDPVQRNPCRLFSASPNCSFHQKAADSVSLCCERMGGPFLGAPNTALIVWRPL